MTAHLPVLKHRTKKGRVGHQPGPVDAALHPSQQANPLVQTDNRRTLPARAASQCAMHHLDTTQTGSSANISKEAEIPEPAREQGEEEEEEEEGGRR